MAKKQTAADMGVPAYSNKDNKPVVRRRPTGGGKVKLDKHGNILPDSTTGK